MKNLKYWCIHCCQVSVSRRVQERTLDYHGMPSISYRVCGVAGCDGRGVGFHLHSWCISPSGRYGGPDLGMLGLDDVEFEDEMKRRGYPVIPVDGVVYL
jgi:hypothetical protein